MLCTGICNIFESVVFIRLCGLFIVSSDNSGSFCIVAVSEGSGTFCNVVVTCCGSGIILNC